MVLSSSPSREARSPPGASCRCVVLVGVHGVAGSSSNRLGSPHRLHPSMAHQQELELSVNPYSWSEAASVLYVDSPAGTGLSYSGAGAGGGVVNPPRRHSHPRPAVIPEVLTQRCFLGMRGLLLAYCSPPPPPPCPHTSAAAVHTRCCRQPGRLPHQRHPDRQGHEHLPAPLVCALLRVPGGAGGGIAVLNMM